MLFHATEAADDHEITQARCEFLGLSLVSINRLLGGTPLSTFHRNEREHGAFAAVLHPCRVCLPRVTHMTPTSHMRMRSMSAPTNTDIYRSKSWMRGTRVIFSTQLSLFTASTLNWCSLDTGIFSIRVAYVQTAHHSLKLSKKCFSKKSGPGRRWCQLCARPRASRMMSPMGST